MIMVLERASVILAGCLLSFLLIHTLAHVTHPSQVSSLRSIKGRLVDPLKNLQSWSKGDPCASKWNGVYCVDTVGTDGYLHIRELQLLNMNLSGTLAPEIGQLSRLEILDFMWNELSGSIPKEMGSISSLKLLLLNGNKLSGSMPVELGYLQNLDRLQLDDNNISGTIPKSFANLSKIKHIHLNNNSLTGQIPPELSRLSTLVHLLLDNNALSGHLPPGLSDLAQLEILQLDNNHLVDAVIPESYQNLPRLVKISLRNCSLGGAMPDFSRVPNLTYIDLSWNQLTGPIPSNNLALNITTIDLSHNKLSGSVPDSFSNLRSLQVLSLENNLLNGSIPSSIWRNKSFNATTRLSIDLRYNLFSEVSGDLYPPENVTLRLRGNPVCNRANIPNVRHFCDSDVGVNGTSDISTYPANSTNCPVHACPELEYYEYVPAAPACFCAVPIRIGYRLKSPSFTYFTPYKIAFEKYITSTFNMERYQLSIDSFAWEKGPRLRMYLKLFPSIHGNHTFDATELNWIRYTYTSWHFPGSKLFGPYELLNFTLLGPYSTVNIDDSDNSGIGKGLLTAILVGAITCSLIMSVTATLLIRRWRNRRQLVSKRNSSVRKSIKIDGVREFTFKQMAQATCNFSSSMQVGRGGYGKVYKGVLADNTTVAIKRAEEGSLQGKHEFLTEIQHLSRLHHRNLVSLLGYCGENGEQMLIYDFMSNGTLGDWLSGTGERTLNFPTRLRIALGAAKGILYLHTEANPPIFHRDIKASNILLDSNLTAKVADFGLSHLAPVLDDEGSVPHHVSTLVKGTPGYLDPEYFLTHKLTDKSDVYSLGVVFLELFTGVPPISHGKNLVREVYIAKESGSLYKIIDNKMGDYPPECIHKFIALAMRCCQDTPELRPPMLDIVRELESLLQMIPDTRVSISETMSPSSRYTSFSASFTNIAKYTSMSSDISGSDLSSTVIPNVPPL